LITNQSWSRTDSTNSGPLPLLGLAACTRLGTVLSRSSPSPPKARTTIKPLFSTSLVSFLMMNADAWLLLVEGHRRSWQEKHIHYHPAPPARYLPGRKLVTQGQLGLSTRPHHHRRESHRMGNYPGKQRHRRRLFVCGF
jgi:hypothetical protein